MKIRHAACSCGQLHLSTRGEPLRISICHCLACKQRTGSAFGVQARFAEADVTVEGQSTEYVRIAEDGEDRTSTRMNSSHYCAYRMPSSAGKKNNKKQQIVNTN